MSSPIVLGSIALGAFLWAASASADQWRSPSLIEQTSPGGQFSVRIEGGKGGPVASIREPGGPVFDLSLHNDNYPVDAAILDSGALLVFDEWHNMGWGDDVVVAYTPETSVDGDGEPGAETARRWQERWRMSLEEVLGEGRARAVPTTVSSRWWRKRPLEWEPVRDERGLWVRVTLHDENQVDLHVAEGISRWHRVADVGDDPERLLARAQTLAREGESEEAVELLERILATSEPEAEFLVRLGYALRDADRSDRAIELLLPHAGEAPPAPSDREASSRRSLWIALASAYTGAGHIADAEAAWRALMVGEPDPWRWVLQIAQLHFSIDADKRALVELSTYYRTMQKQEEGELTSTLRRAAGNVGSMMLQRGHPEKARLYLAKAWDPENIDLHRGINYAEVLEKTGDPAQAREIWRALAEHLGEDPIYRFYREKAEAALERLASSSPEGPAE